LECIGDVYGSGLSKWINKEITNSGLPRELNRELTNSRWKVLGIEDGMEEWYI